MIRALVHLFGIQPAVATIVVNDGKVLLTKRAKFLAEGGKWCLPGGGMKKWETAEVAARRETYEEAGLKLNKLKLLFVQEEMVRRLRVHAHVFVFGAKFSGNVKTNWEVSEYAWFSKAEIDKMDLAFTHKEILNKYFRSNK